MAVDDPMVVELVARGVCESCNGSGAQATPEWQHFNEWADEKGLSGRDRMEKVEHYFLEEEGMGSVPPEEEECLDCKGSGKSEVLVDATQLLDAFLDHVPQTVIRRGELEEMVENVKTAMQRAAVASQGIVDENVEGASSHLRVVTEGAEALRSLADLLRPKA